MSVYRSIGTNIEVVLHIRNGPINIVVVWLPQINGKALCRTLTLILYFADGVHCTVQLKIGVTPL